MSGLGADIAVSLVLFSMSDSGSETLKTTTYKKKVNLIHHDSRTRPRGYKTFFMLNSTHEIYYAHKCQNDNNGWHFNILTFVSIVNTTSKITVHFSYVFMPS